MKWGMKGIWSPPFSVLCSFHRQNVSMMFRHAQVIFILRHAIAIGENSSMLDFLSRGSTISCFDILLAIKGVWKLDVPLVVHPCRWLICCLGHVGPCSLFSLFWMLWLFYGWHGFLNVLLNWWKNSNTIVWKLIVAWCTQLLHWMLCFFTRVFWVSSCL
jgi:hypothetical protein